MKPVELKVTRIGNSRGIRLPADALKRYQVEDTPVMEERSDGILLRVPGRAVAELSWEETAAEMAAANEDWSEWETTLDDGLDDVRRDAAKPRRVGTLTDAEATALRRLITEMYGE
jgi:antitoxin component of MazEF toxin-antitoxin module